MNSHKGMVLLSCWAKKEEVERIKKIIHEEYESNEELGNIFYEVIKRGDMDLK